MAVKCTHTYTDETCFFWCCPECERAPSKDGWPHLNIGRDHWFFCDTHKRKGWVGSNLFSAWREESPEIWKRNKEKLAGYRIERGYQTPATTPAAADVDDDMQF